MRKLFIIILVLFSVVIESQSIRKNYLEMTIQEQIDYRTALNLKQTEINHLAEHHSDQFCTEIHSGCGTGEWFTAWHRVFLLDLEFLLKNSNGASSNYLSLTNTKVSCHIQIYQFLRLPHQ